MYDPKVARFLQEDTYLGETGDPLSLNLYTYCHNEPIMYVDITGYAYVLQQWSSIDLQIYARNNKTLNKKLESVFGRKDRIYYNVSDGVLLSYLISEDKAFVSEYTQYKYTDDKNRIYKYKLQKKPGWIFGGSKVVEVGLGFVPYLQKASNSITTSINFVGEKLFGVVGGSSQTTGKEFAKSIEDDVKDFGKSALAKQLDKYTDAFAGKVMDAIDYGKKLDDYVSNNKWKMEEVTFDLIEMADISLYGNDLNELSEREVFIHEYIIDHEEYFIENCAVSNGAMYSLYKVDKGLKEEFNRNGWSGVKKRIDSEIYLLSQKLNNTNLSIQEKTKVMDGYKNALLYYDERLNYVEKALEIIYYGGTDDEGKYYKGYYNEKNLKNNGIYVY